jgi:hypothetical protein
MFAWETKGKKTFKGSLKDELFTSIQKVTKWKEEFLVK